MKQFQLQVNTELEALNEVLQWFEQSAQCLIPQESGWQCQLALAEGFTNIVRYAHHNLPSTTPIDCLVNLSDHEIEIKIWDRGAVFDFKTELNTRLQRQKKNRQQKCDPLAEGESGRGLVLMSQLMDEVDYIHTPNQGNCLVMRKKIA